MNKFFGYASEMFSEVWYVAVRLVAAAAVIPLLIGGVVSALGVWPTPEEIYYASFGWLAAAMIYPAVVAGWFVGMGLALAALRAVAE